MKKTNNVTKVEFNKENSMNVEQFENYLVLENVSSNTVESYCTHVRGYFKWLYGAENKEFVKKLFRQNILDFIGYLKSRQQNGKTINAKLSALARLNEFLIEKGLQDDKVIVKKDYIKIQTEIASFSKIKEAEVDAFRQRVLEEEGARNYAIVTMLAYAGPRISECLGLYSSNISLEAKEMIVLGKGNKQRKVFLNDKIVNAVNMYIKEKEAKGVESEYLFVSNWGNKIDRSVMNKMFNKYSHIMTPHMLRHFYCSNAYKKGLGINFIANQAGHANIATTMIYTNPDSEQAKEDVNKL